ncbi:MAG: class I SAM-dependent methyltransferase [Candidatus Omnitrophota bacterium]
MTQNIYENLVIPEKYSLISISKDEAEYIHFFLKEKNIKKTLEIGLAFGCSAAHIISATESRHYAIDPFQEKFKNLGLKNLKNLGFDKYLTFKNDFSYNILPQFLDDGMKFDFIFIDGDHKFDFAFVDFFFADLLLNQGSYILFHDSWMPALQSISSWIKTNRKDYSLVKTPQANLILFQKNSRDDRPWDHFEDFYTSKPRIRKFLHKIIHKKKRVNFFKTEKSCSKKAQGGLKTEKIKR